MSGSPAGRAPAATAAGRLIARGRRPSAAASARPVFPAASEGWSAAGPSPDTAGNSPGAQRRGPAGTREAAGTDGPAGSSERTAAGDSPGLGPRAGAAPEAGPGVPRSGPDRAGVAEPDSAAAAAVPGSAAMTRAVAQLGGQPVVAWLARSLDPGLRQATVRGAGAAWTAGARGPAGAPGSAGAAAHGPMARPAPPAMPAGAGPALAGDRTSEASGVARPTGTGSGPASLTESTRRGPHRGAHGDGQSSSGATPGPAITDAVPASALGLAAVTRRTTAPADPAPDRPGLDPAAPDHGVPDHGAAPDRAALDRAAAQAGRRQSALGAAELTRWRARRRPDAEQAPPVSIGEIHVHVAAPPGPPPDPLAALAPYASGITARRAARP